jgi:hypothetical protein
VSDIFREVEEDVRREKAQRIWSRYGTYIIAAGVLVFVGIGAWQVWQHFERQKTEVVSGQYIAAQRIANPQAAANAFVDLAKDGQKYSPLARLSQASAMFAAGQRKEAIEIYREIADSDKGGPIGSVARLRAAWAMSETATRTELAELLKPLDTAGNPWRENAAEILAFADYKAMDLKSALTKYTALSTNSEAPDSLRARAKAMTDYLKNGGAVTFGTVPPEVVVPPPPAAAADPAAAGATPAMPAP